MNRKRLASRWPSLAVATLSVPFAGAAAAPESAEGGGEVIDGGTFVGGPPEHIDPALNTTLDAYQVINALYDGLTDIDVSDPENTRIVPLLAESYEPNADATVWTFTIRDGLQFADGEPILPSTFQRSWERASDPDFAGDYSYLFNFIEGGAEKLAGDADTISGVVADDDAMTLTVTLSAPYSNFDAVAGFQLFFPVPEAADESPADYENSLMVGNGPYTLEEPRTDEQILLVRNDNWAGDFNGETWEGRPERITLRVFADPDTSYNALEAGEVDTAQIPPARSEEARSNWGTTLDTSLLASYHYVFNLRDERVGGEENKLLREAISMAIDRDTINAAVFNGMRTVSTGITPPGIPGFAENLCDYCAYDPDGAQAAYDEWLAAGNEPQTDPDPVQQPTPGTSRWWRSSSTTWRRSASRPSPTRGSPRPTSPSSPTAPACSAGSAGPPTTRRTTTSCTTSSTATRSTATTTATSTRSSMH